MKSQNLTRRMILKILFAASVALAFFPWLLRKWGSAMSDERKAISSGKPADSGIPLGADEDGLSRVYVARNGTPEQNVRKVIEMMGGIEAFIEPNDIVVLKPNAQWWNQGMTNTDAMKGFIDMVLAMPGFSGEVIVADNHQCQEDNSRGWSTDKRNGKFNLNELVAHYRKKGHQNVTKHHWRVAGTAAIPLQGNGQGDSRVSGPEDGDGYVWLENSYYLSPAGKKCVMTYPIFTSAYSGVTVDLKNGPWQNGGYLHDRKVRFINFSALNHHTWYCGVTASVKNLMGVVDMTCGFPGDAPEGTYNTHHIGVSKKILWTKKRGVWRLGSLVNKFVEYCYRNFHHTGGALGHFMKSVRMPDLNIITAEWVGWGSRTDTQKAFYPKTILAARDPVALDYIAAIAILLPGTPMDAYEPRSGLAYNDLNNPDIEGGPFRKFLSETKKQGIGNLSQKKIRVISNNLA